MFRQHESIGRFGASPTLAAYGSGTASCGSTQGYQYGMVAAAATAETVTLAAREPRLTELKTDGSSPPG